MKFSGYVNDNYPGGNHENNSIDPALAQTFSAFYISQHDGVGRVQFNLRRTETGTDPDHTYKHNNRSAKRPITNQTK